MYPPLFFGSSRTCHTKYSKGSYASLVLDLDRRHSLYGSSGSVFRRQRFTGGADDSGGFTLLWLGLVFVIPLQAEYFFAFGSRNRVDHGNPCQEINRRVAGGAHLIPL